MGSRCLFLRLENPEYGKYWRCNLLNKNECFTSLPFDIRDTFYDNVLIDTRGQNFICSIYLHLVHQNM